MAVQHISSNEFDDVIKCGDIVLVDFFATWCGPCKIVSPVLDQISNELPDGQRIVKIDVDENPSVAQRYGILSIPTLIAFKDGEVVNQAVGVHSKEQILELFQL